MDKYRAWFDGKMYFVSELMFNSTGVCMATLTNTDAREIYHYQTNDIRTIELMQYIGFKDRNDKEIYRGDILSDMFGARQEVVSFVDGNYVLSGFMLRRIKRDDLVEGYQVTERGWLRSAEVIGNRYEHPHLLERMIDEKNYA
jgi:uncharacterized phage protein (TIGR01671 family)